MDIKSKIRKRDVASWALEVVMRDVASWASEVVMTRNLKIIVGWTNLSNLSGELIIKKGVTWIDLGCLSTLSTLSTQSMMTSSF